MRPMWCALFNCEYWVKTKFGGLKRTPCAACFFFLSCNVVFLAKLLWLYNL